LIKLRIFILVPILKQRAFEEVAYAELKAAARKDVELVVDSIVKGPASIESEYDEVLAGPWIVEKAEWADKNGFDAIIIDCMGDPALEAAREITRIPVVGPCQSSMALASTISDRFTAVTVLKRLIPLFWRNAKRYGFESKMASVRSVEVPVLELDEKRDEVKAILLEESKKALDEDSADAIILGCTGMVGMARELQEALKVPVIDPAIASLKLAETLVDMKLSHTKLVYPEPPPKERRF
jgi:allantoin racemase